MSEIHYVLGDATAPQGNGPKVIAHICNDVGGWGRGFVVALSAKWREPEAAYREWHRNSVATGRSLPLGKSDLVQVAPDLWVVNMIAQRGIRNPGNPCAVDYEALRECLDEVSQGAPFLGRWLPGGATGSSVHMPRIGTGLGGGEWSKVEAIILETLVSRGVEVFVYDLPTPENIEAHHQRDEADEKFQSSLHELAQVCSQCGQPLPQAAAAAS